MKIKYQIFVSSTYEDLKDERDLVIKAILEMGHIPVGMEMFSAGDEEQWKLIQKQIDDCDYYVVIAAHRYGSEDGTIGYTEKEYDYAVSKSIPALGFVITDSASWPVNKSDTTTDKKEKLDKFKAKIKKKLISHWTNKEDLYGKVSIALMKQFTVNPRDGWTKANASAGPQVLTELSRLSKENSDLREEIESLKQKAKNDEKDRYSDLAQKLENIKVNLSFFYKDGKAFEDSTDVPLFKIFKILATDLMVENTTTHCVDYLCYKLRVNNKRTLREKYPIPKNVISGMFSDLVIYGLLQPSNKRKSLKDKEEYWSLTPDGLNFYKELRLTYLENSKPKLNVEKINDKLEK